MLMNRLLIYIGHRPIWMLLISALFVGVSMFLWQTEDYPGRHYRIDLFDPLHLSLAAIYFSATLIVFLIILVVVAFFVGDEVMSNPLTDQDRE